MKHFKVFLFLLAILGTDNTKGQPFKVIKATSQRWVGGVVGHSGIKYNIELETKQKKIIPDTLYVNGESYPIDFYSKYGDCKRSYDSITGKITYDVLVSESHNDIHHERPNTNDTSSVKPKPVRQFDGTATISYYIKSLHTEMGKKHEGKECIFKITSFTKLQTLNYP